LIHEDVKAIFGDLNIFSAA